MRYSTCLLPPCVLLQLCLALLAVQAVVPWDAGQLGALITIRDTLDISSFTGWEVTNDCSKWSGVECDPTSGLVVAVTLPKCTGGTLPDNINSLANSLLYFSTGECTPIKKLNWVNCFSTLTAVTYLDLKWNFSAVTNDIGILCNLPLTHLALTGITTAGVPACLSAINSLTSLSFSIYPPNSTIVSTACANTQLQELSLSNGHIYSSIPSCIADLVSLQSLDLSNNLLFGPIPDLTPLTALTSLNLQNNYLSGEIPILPATNSSTPAVDLTNNYFYGTPDITFADGSTADCSLYGSAGNCFDASYTCSGGQRDSTQCSQFCGTTVGGTSLTCNRRGSCQPYYKFGLKPYEASAPTGFRCMCISGYRRRVNNKETCTCRKIVRPCRRALFQCPQFSICLSFIPSCKGYKCVCRAQFTPVKNVDGDVINCVHR